MVAPGRDDAIVAVPDTAPLCAIGDLNGVDMQAITRAIGRPLIAALDDKDDAGMYGWLWRALLTRDGVHLTYADVQVGYKLSAVLELFAAANGDGAGVDPTSAGSGDA
jgi:hypothetical protein